MKKKLVLGVTAGGSSKLLAGQAKYFIEKGYEVYLISEDHFKERLFCEREGCIHLPVKITKRINPIKDLASLFQIIRHFKKIKPDIVNVGTPKMGLLGILAAYFLGIQNRVYTCRGLRYENTAGLSGRLIRMMEKITNRLAKKVIFVGFSLREAAEMGGTLYSNKSVVIGKGSSNGVNSDEFNPDLFYADQKLAIRNRLALTNNQFIIGYVGRVSRRKGSEELYDAFTSVQNTFPECRLLVVGHMDCSKELEEKFRTHPAIIYLGWSDEIPALMSIMDVFVLPSWQEGFSNVCIQAASMGLPVITTTATGCRDAIKDGFNGMLYPFGNSAALQKLLLGYLENNERRKLHAKNSRTWAAEFKQQVIWDGIEKVYENKTLVN
ncbi:glycosyltransferase family 4 protein [Flavihumibacter sp. CACIAM 22H1]|uniref:glycosyltransferase family 4 protein n=1 Tax=Flavihumibacter sp. CACIAM 22H1 TaxID=1812911 RepID=UPI0007A87787|nr:glycosyltransferase family 4 protein [Flavihumibacter sp. CACIAM 22H1]KYP15117.1 MAG: hypothetical protein A1D16_12460 [Flavihumibacter sp. CACIAM 22H1]